MSARDASWCRLRRVLCIPQVQQCTEKPLLFWLSKQLPRYRGFLLRVKSPKNRSRSRARPSNYDRHLSLKYKYKVRKPHFRRPAHVLARLRGSRCGTTAPPLHAHSCGLKFGTGFAWLYVTHRGNVRAITTPNHHPHQTPTGGLRRSRSALALVLHRLCAVPVCLLKGQERTGRVRGQT